MVVRKDVGEVASVLELHLSVHHSVCAMATVTMKIVRSYENKKLFLIRIIIFENKYIYLLYSHCFVATTVLMFYSSY